jgi:hypothetical protein
MTTVTPTLSQRPDAVVLRWIARLADWWRFELAAGDAHVRHALQHLDDRMLRDIGLEHLVARGRR